MNTFLYIPLRNVYIKSDPYLAIGVYVWTSILCIALIQNVKENFSKQIKNKRTKNRNGRQTRQTNNDKILRIVNKSTFPFEYIKTKNNILFCKPKTLKKK